MGEAQNMQQVTDAAFRPYGRILPLDTKAFVKTIGMRPPTAAGVVVFPPSMDRTDVDDVTSSTSNSLRPVRRDLTAGQRAQHSPSWWKA